MAKITGFVDSDSPGADGVRAGFAASIDCTGITACSKPARERSGGPCRSSRSSPRCSGSGSGDAAVTASPLGLAGRCFVSADGRQRLSVRAGPQDTMRALIQRTTRLPAVLGKTIRRVCAG